MRANDGTGFSIYQNDSRDRPVAMVFDPLQKTWRSDVLTEVVAGVCGQSEVAVHK